MKTCFYILHKDVNRNVSCDHLLCELSSYQIFMFYQHSLHSKFVKEVAFTIYFEVYDVLFQGATLDFLGLIMFICIDMLCIRNI